MNLSDIRYNVARALATSKPIPYNPNGVWEETVQNVADALSLPMNSPVRTKFLADAEVSQ